MEARLNKFQTPTLNRGGQQQTSVTLYWGNSPAVLTGLMDGFQNVSVNRRNH
jgi:hypothetical protein